ncbi:hypothetical protein [Portibacter marinus]|uniref:hypothetical protein n=1 Tax=Portibacter marinus TaxID=2898660 RepID=UPI001F22E7B2|nr:hypothetical protein [Portibacter marinus]
MKKGLAGALSILGVVMIIIGVLGAFGVMSMGTFTWVAIILGIIFFPAGISLMKSTNSTE